MVRANDHDLLGLLSAGDLGDQVDGRFAGVPSPRQRVGHEFRFVTDVAQALLDPVHRLVHGIGGVHVALSNPFGERAHIGLQPLCQCLFFSGQFGQGFGYGLSRHHQHP